MQLSVTIIAKNAEKTLDECLASATKISDDVVLIIDDSSSDNTGKIAEKYKIRIFTKKFINFSEQKNYAASKANNEWILSLDADEVLSDGLIEEIAGFNPESEKFGIKIPRKNIIFSKLIKYTNWDPNPILRIYSRKVGTWSGIVHEEVSNIHEFINFKNPIIHTNYFTVEQFLDKQNLYSTFLSKKSNDFNYINLFLFPLLEFFRRFIWHKGFLDDWHGLYLSYLMAIYQLTVMIKKWEKANIT